jgi:molybdopterin-guanine dinucleotide biosynthesis protein A
MGRSKADLFLDRIVTAATPVFEHVVAVERAGGTPRTIPTIFEPVHEDEAPLFGIARALEDAPGRCFILATDFAGMRTELLRDLRLRFEISNASMLVPVWGGEPQILCAGYAGCVLPAVNRRIAARTFDILGLLDEVEVEFVTDPAGAPVNVNTPEDLENYERFLSSR